MNSPALLAAALVGLLALVLFGRLPADGLWAAELSNFAHGPVFAGVALIAMAGVRRWSRFRFSLTIEYALALAFSLLLGAAVEGVQAVIGRDAELGDLVRDALGALAALGFLAFSERTTPPLAGTSGWRSAVGVVVGTVATVALLAPLAIVWAAYRERNHQFPILANFERPCMTYFVATLGEVGARRDRLPPGFARGGRRAMALRITPTGRRWWGVALREPVADWTRFEKLKVVIANPAPTALRIRVRLFDDRHESGEPAPFSTIVTLAPRSVRAAEIALGDARASTGLDLANVRSMMIGRSGRQPASEFYVLRAWLE